MMTYILLAAVACLPLLRSVAAAPAPYMHFGALGTVTVTVTLPCSASAALPSGSPSPPLFHAANFVADVSSSSVGPAVSSSASFVAPNPSPVSGSVAGPSASVIDPSAPVASSAAPSASVSAANPAVSPGASSVDNQDVISLASSLDNLVYAMANNADSATLSTVVGTFLGSLKQLLNSLSNSSVGMTSDQTTHLDNALVNAMGPLATAGSLPSSVGALVQQVINSLYQITSTGGVAPSTRGLAGNIAYLLQKLLNGSASASASVI